MLCKAENRDPAHCLKEGRKVTRCAQDLCVAASFPPSPCSFPIRGKTTLIVRNDRTQDRQGPVDVLEGV